MAKKVKRTGKKVNKEIKCDCNDCKLTPAASDISRTKLAVQTILGILVVVAVFVMLVILLNYLGCNREVIAVEIVKPVVSVTETKKTTPLATVTWDDFRAVQKEAKSFSDKEDYCKACESYLAYADIAAKLGKPDIKAWGLNNAAYMNILRYQRNQGFKPEKELEVYLVEAKGFLDVAMKIKEASLDCSDKMLSNYMFIVSRIPPPPKPVVTSDGK